jgi:trimethylamine--corrinoid protein Co-methyltransferase
LDVIHEVGPAEQFLGHPHTLEHLRENMWLPLAFDHDGFETWESKGSQDYTSRARQIARDMVESHQPEPIPEVIDNLLLELKKAPGS